MRSSVPPAHPSRQSSTTLVHCLYSEHKYSVGVVCMKEDESLRVERETVTAYRSTRKRQADAKRHVERDEPSRSEGLNCNERLGSRTERGRNAGTRLNETPTGPGCGTGHATAHGPRHAAPGPDRTAVPLAPHSGREHARRGNRPAHRGAAPAAGRAVQTPVLPSFARADDM